MSWLFSNGVLKVYFSSLVGMYMVGVAVDYTCIGKNISI